MEQRLSSWKLLLTLKAVVGAIHQPAGHFKENSLRHSSLCSSSVLLTDPQSLKKITNVSLLFSTWLIWSYFHILISSFYDVSICTSDVKDSIPSGILVDIIILSNFSSNFFYNIVC